MGSRLPYADANRADSPLGLRDRAFDRRRERAVIQDGIEHCVTGPSLSDFHDHVANEILHAVDVAQ